jgi:hypothetical protein
VQRLDNLIQEEARMAYVELLKITHSVDGQVKDIGKNVQYSNAKLEQVDRSLPL